MTPPFVGQHNPYKGRPPRPWVRVRLLAADGTFREVELIVDTGSPFPLVVSEALLMAVSFKESADVDANFGFMAGGWFRLVIPEVSLNCEIHGYGCDNVFAGARESHSDFGGLMGLPALRLIEYGGDADGFWIRPAKRLSP